MRGFRTHIGIFGRRNAGKSSVVNALTRQRTAIVSDVPGTTTDPVAKPMELQPLGPVVLIDTAGIDDTGALGSLRNDRSRSVLDRCDIVLLVAAAGDWRDEDEALLCELESREVPVILVFNKSDVARPADDLLERLAPRCSAVVQASATGGEGVEDLRLAIVGFAPPTSEKDPVLIRDLVPPGETAILVVPIDKEAPVGRLIMPQVNAIRDLLDGDSLCMVVKENGLAAALENLKRPPALVVTDSQAFDQVNGIVPRDVPLTGFSVLLSRLRGDLRLQAEGARAIDNLKPGDRVLMAEACSHHPVEDDIGRVKIPRWLSRKVGGVLRFDTVQGHDFPDDLDRYDLVVHCGGCTLNRTEVVSRLNRCRDAGVPVTNYGLTIAHCFGMLERALEPFKAAEDRDD